MKNLLLTALYTFLLVCCGSDKEGFNDFYSRQRNDSSTDRRNLPSPPVSRNPSDLSPEESRYPSYDRRRPEEARYGKRRRNNPSYGSRPKSRNYRCIYEQNGSESKCIQFDYISMKNEANLGLYCKRLGIRNHRFRLMEARSCGHREWEFQEHVGSSRRNYKVFNKRYSRRGSKAARIKNRVRFSI